MIEIYETKLGTHVDNPGNFFIALKLVKSS